MKTLPSLNRNDVIRVIALMSVVAFPLIADAQLGLGTRAVKTSNNVSPAAAGTAKATIAGRDSCADQHWPFLSNGCLRGSTEAIQPRLVSMNVESPPNSTDDPAKVNGAIDTAQGSARFARPKTLVKPRATHRRERRNIGVSYAVNSEMAHPAGW
jgi:hypothetical protein